MEKKNILPNPMLSFNELSENPVPTPALTLNGSSVEISGSNFHDVTGSHTITLETTSIIFPYEEFINSLHSDVHCTRDSTSSPASPPQWFLKRLVENEDVLCGFSVFDSEKLEAAVQKSIQSCASNQSTGSNAIALTPIPSAAVSICLGELEQSPLKRKATSMYNLLHKNIAKKRLTETPGAQDVVNNIPYILLSDEEQVSLNHREGLPENISQTYPTELHGSKPDLSSALDVLHQVSETKPFVNLLTYPPPPQTGGIEITDLDLDCLKEERYINDSIIDFYLMYIFQEKLSPYKRRSTFIFNSFFYSCLTSKLDKTDRGDEPDVSIQEKRHNLVKRWTRRVDIFSKEYVIIPVIQNAHWFLVIICNPSCVPDVTSTNTQQCPDRVTIEEISSNGENSPNQDEQLCSQASVAHSNESRAKILIFDSFRRSTQYRVPLILREYLDMEWKNRKGSEKLYDETTIPAFNLQCPQQTNKFDCGLYLLQFVESFYENPIHFGISMPDLLNWFTLDTIKKKREQLKALILKIKEEQRATRVDARQVKTCCGQ